MCFSTCWSSVVKRYVLCFLVSQQLHCACCSESRSRWMPTSKPRPTYSELRSFATEMSCYRVVVVVGVLLCIISRHHRVPSVVVLCGERFSAWNGACDPSALYLIYAERTRTSIFWWTAKHWATLAIMCADTTPLCKCCIDLEPTQNQGAYGTGYVCTLGSSLFARRLPATFCYCSATYS